MPVEPDRDPYFNAGQLPRMQPAYVAWLDVMGVRAIMGRSLPATANFVFKLHIAALEGRDGIEITLYPVMDGMYVVSSTRRGLVTFLQRVFVRLARMFVHEERPEHQFIVKSAIAFGPVIQGADIPRAASESLDEAGAYKGALLLGMPMVQAVQGEPKAPPFGIFVDVSARAFAPARERPFNQVWWHWWPNDNTELRDSLSAALARYYEWASAHHSAIEYDPERIAVHRVMAAEYLQPD